MTPAVTEKQICRYLAGNLELVKERAKEYVCREIDRLTAKELKERFLEGRLQYGGEFDVESIPCIEELRRESQDVVLYTVLLAHQDEH